MWPNLQIPADLVTFTEEILNGKVHFLCCGLQEKALLHFFVTEVHQRVTSKNCCTKSPKNWLDCSIWPNLTTGSLLVWKLCRKRYFLCWCNCKVSFVIMAFVNANGKLTSLVFVCHFWFVFTCLKMLSEQDM